MEFLPKNIGYIKKLETAINGLYQIQESVLTVQAMTGINYFKDPIEALNQAKIKLEILKNEP